MRKIIFIFVLLSCFSAGFADTGYRGIPWYSNAEVLPKLDQIIYNDLFIYEKIILGKKTHLFYAFYENQFQFASYIITKDKTEALKKELKKLKKTEIKCILSNASEYIANSQLEAEEWMIGDAFSIVYELEKLTLEEIKAEEDKSADGRITIYDYNDDTRCYVIENYIPEKTAVVYVPYEQDY